MHLVSWLALIFLTLSGYSAGAVLGSRIRRRGHRDDPFPTLLDTIMVVVLWIGGITSVLIGVGVWLAVGVWLGIALVVALILNQVQSQSIKSKPLPL
jgi:hypothetical protein